MSKPVKAVDVAEHILSKQGPLSTWKLQKLCYYAQAWSLVWDDEPLFDDQTEAWANGPVIPALYARHRGRFRVTTMGGDSDALTDNQVETVNAVLDSYGAKAGVWLSELTHSELPWREARRRAGLSPGERGSAVIRLKDMAEYYGGLYDGSEEED